MGNVDEETCALLAEEGEKLRATLIDYLRHLGALGEISGLLRVQLPRIAEEVRGLRLATERGLAELALLHGVGTGAGTAELREVSVCIWSELIARVHPDADARRGGRLLVAAPALLCAVRAHLASDDEDSVGDSHGLMHAALAIVDSEDWQSALHEANKLAEEIEDG